MSSISHMANPDRAEQFPHPHDSDLTAVLTAPSGTQITLFSVGGLNPNFTNTIFYDAGGNLCAGGAPFSNMFQPAAGTFASLIGTAMNGTWTLTVTDNTAGSSGTLNSWKLIPFTVTPGTAASLAGTIPVALENRTFQISGFPVQTVSGTYTATVGPDPFSNYIKDDQAANPVIKTGGAGYAVGQILTVSGGILAD